MTMWLSAGMVFAMSAVLLILVTRGRQTVQGEVATPLWVFVAILFTSGLDVGLIMFPLTEFPVYADPVNAESYDFSNPLAIEFGFWGFLVWALYFLTCFYFCAIEPKVKFFDIAWVRFINNMVIIGTCAFTAFLLYSNLSWYWPDVPFGIPQPVFYGIVVGVTIFLAVCSSTHLKFVSILSVSSGILFFALLAGLVIYALLTQQATHQDFLLTGSLVVDYFNHLPKFILPINDYHAFYLFWWFAWSIMIGQFTARFVGEMKTLSLFFHMLFWPSMSIGIWFGVLYVYYQNQIPTEGLINLVMILVGLVFVLNSLDSLIRLYSDNLGLTLSRMGAGSYILLHFTLMTGLCVLFSLDFLQIQWIGALVIGLVFLCVVYIVYVSCFHKEKKLSI